MKENRPVTCGIIDSIFDCCSVQPMIILFVYILFYVYTELLVLVLYCCVYTVLYYC